MFPWVSWGNACCLKKRVTPRADATSSANPGALAKSMSQSVQEGDEAHVCYHAAREDGFPREGLRGAKKRGAKPKRERGGIGFYFACIVRCIGLCHHYQGENNNSEKPEKREKTKD